MTEKLRSFPLIPDAAKEIEELVCAAWGHLNGKSLSRTDVHRIAMLMSELDWFARYGQPDACPATIHHGPGHQSRTGCDLGLTPHTIHEAHVMDGRARWKGLIRFSGYFDELPQDDE